MTNSRRKGAAFENEIARLLSAELGIPFKRNLEQYQTKDLGDLNPVGCPAFPFVIECKNAAQLRLPAWTAQVFKSAEITKLHPALIYKQRRGVVAVRIWFDALAAGLGGHAVSTQHADLTLQGFAYICREIMADAAAQAAQ